jgi:hypothetical protein
MHDPLLVEKVELVTPERRILVAVENNFEVSFEKMENYDFTGIFLKIRPSIIFTVFLSLLHEKRLILVGDDNLFNT